MESKGPRIFVLGSNDGTPQWLRFQQIDGIMMDPYVPWSKVAILGMVIPPLIGILIMGI